MTATAVFLKIQYLLGKLTAQQVQALVGVKLTQQQADIILGGSL